MGQVRRTVHVPLGGDTGRALGLPCQPASCQGGPGSVGMLPAAERDMRQPHRGGADGVSSVLGDGRRCPSQPVDYRTWGGACRGRVGGDVNGVQRGCKGVCSVSVGPRCPPGRKTCHQETLGYSSGHGGVWRCGMGAE